MSCNICLENDNIIKTCTCSHQAHLECIKSWHNIKYGRIIRKGNLCCPLCKAPGKSIKFFKNDQEIKNTLDELNKNPEWSYIFCSSCKNLKQYMKESCSNYIDTKYRLVCSDCSPKKYKECPKCCVMIEKEDGCAHMYCLMCKTHFCWICSEIHDEKDIYDHIDKIHNNNTKHNIQYQNYLYQIENKLIKFENILDIFLTEELVKLALKYDWHTLKYIDQTKELCLIAVKHNGNALVHVKEQDREICLEAVKQNGNALVHVDKQDKEICLEAVKQNGCALQYVDDRDKEICLEAVKQNGCALQYVDERDKEICLEAVKQDGNALKFVKEQDREICLEAVKQNGNALRYIKISNFPINISNISKKIKNPPVNVSDSLVDEQDRKICLEAVRNRGDALQYVKNQDKEICLIAVENDGSALKHVKNKDNEICLIAVRQIKISLDNYHILKYVKEQNEDICLVAVNQSNKSLKYVKKQFGVVEDFNDPE